MQIESCRLRTLALRLRNGYGNITFKKDLAESDINQVFIKRCLKDSEINTASQKLIELQNKNISFVCLWEESYPSLLKEIYDPPIILFYKGNLGILSKEGLSIVGTRKITAYGKSILKKLLSKLQSLDIITISGGAFGIDSEVHSLSIKNNIETVGVLATSLDNLTPKSNISLFNSILRNGGLLVSETLPNDKITAANFVKRNRIISGLSEKTIVVEAPKKSGALQTADFAFNQNREVYSFPNSIFSQNSFGTNMLIKNTVAEPILDTDEFIAKLANKASLSLSTNDLVFDNTSQESIFSKISSGSNSIDSLLETTGLSYSEIIKTCSELELRNIIGIESSKYVIKTP